MLLLYEFLLRLYPAAYRAEYAEEMVAVLSEVLTEDQKKGWAIAFPLCCPRNYGPAQRRGPRAYQAHYGFHSRGKIPFKETHNAL